MKKTIAALTLILAFLTGEIQGTTTKTCIYEALGNTYTITIGAVALCPLNIEVE